MSRGSSFSTKGRRASNSVHIVIIKGQIYKCWLVPYVLYGDGPIFKGIVDRFPENWYGQNELLMTYKWS